MNYILAGFKIGDSVEWVPVHGVNRRNRDEVVVFSPDRWRFARIVPSRLLVGVLSPFSPYDQHGEVKASRIFRDATDRIERMHLDRVEMLEVAGIPEGDA